MKKYLVRNPQKPIKHTYLPVSQLKIFTPRIQRIVAQTSRLSVNKNTDIVAAMLRVILDLTCYQFFNDGLSQRKRCK